MSTYRSLNQTVLAKIESTPGVDSSPTVGSNAVLVENPSLSLGLNSIDTNEVTGALDTRGPIPAGGAAQFSCDVLLHGSGAAATPPEYGVLLRACGMAETITNADVTGTAGAGTTTSITLTGKSSADDAYLGMIIETTGGTGGSPAQTRMITGYNGTSKIATVTPAWTTTPDNTTAYAIRTNVQYRPTSVLENATLYRYMHRSDSGNSRLQKVLGAAGTFSINLQAGQAGRISFQMQGGLATPADVSKPADPTYQTQRPVPYLSAQTLLGGVLVALNQFQLDVGGEVQTPGDPNTAFGVALAGLTRRNTRGRFVPPMELLSTRNAFNAWLAQTTTSFAVWYGTAAGGRVAILVPQVQYVGVEEQDVNGYGYEGLPFAALGSNRGFIVTFW